MPIISNIDIDITLVPGWEDRVREIVLEELVEDHLRRENPPLDRVAVRRAVLRAEVFSRSEGRRDA